MLKPARSKPFLFQTFVVKLMKNKSNLTPNKSFISSLPEMLVAVTTSSSPFRKTYRIICNSENHVAAAPRGTLSPLTPNALRITPTPKYRLTQKKSIAIQPVQQSHFNTRKSQGKPSDRG